MTATEPDTAQAEPEQAPVEDPRAAWLEVALADPEGGAGALATAARHGRPLPPRTS